ncbi:MULTISPECIES: GNAT family N-acetyltransferase [Burkholderiaceae]|uniref:Histone acetyltransferase HPA2 n=1 Tax=Caballeronia sordidicola TaxID=196367 RepID=A0A242N3F0_CABSO|nr:MULTISPECIES: GNAT family N-acetyltransferase [Burkholderiaceae]AMH43740.1 GCN5 family acetyltransferase [Burkholderia sp. PAMC 26561]OTP78103.1 Histone acetyltransferase HPA2 [Caballeronia sordidicola]
MSDQVAYRPFTDEDIAAAHALTVELKWPHRAEDWQFVAQAGAGFVAIEAGEVVGTALYWTYGDDRASLGMVIVSPARQGLGIGRKLMESVLEALEGRVTFLHATLAGQPLYEKLGFRAVGTLDQHQGTAFQPPLMALPSGERLRPLGTNDTARLIDLASRACGLDRTQTLPALLANADGIGLDRDGELIGFSLFRRFGRGFAIGPVVAPGSDPVRAKALISHWLSLNEGVFIRIDTPAECGLTEWLDGLGLPRVDSVMKMVLNAPAATGRDNPDDDCRQFAIINQAML